MAKQTETPRSRSRQADNRRYFSSLALLVLIALFIVWQTVAYRGVIAVLAEWQFDVLGRYRPLLTFLVFMTLLSVPLYLFGLTRKRSTQSQAARRARRLSLVLLSTALILAIIALVTYAVVRMSPENPNAPVRVRVDTAHVPPLGPVTLEGEVMYDRITTLDERIWLLSRNIRFVPVVAPGGGGRGSRLSYFVALPPVDPNYSSKSPRAWTGTLREGGLPGEIIRLYRYAGYRVEAPYYVLFTQPETLHWPELVVALQFAIGSLIALIGGLLQLTHARSMLRALEPVRETPQEHLG